MFFAGKGGVGKTTSASAFAVRERLQRRVLIVSTDPAHSLGDVLGVKLASRPKRIAAGLDAVELDAPRAFARWLRNHRAAVEEVLAHGTWLDRADVDALLDLAIPGVDELAAFLEIAGADDGTFRPRGTARNGSYDLIVVDSAPTGHTLRLLAAPETVATVADVFDALQQQHRVIRDQLARVGGKPEAADRLIALLAQQAHDTAARLQDATQTTFQWVTLAEKMSLAESEDGIAALGRGGMTVSGVVVNNVVPDGDACPLCDRRRADERQVIGAIERRFGRGRTVRLIPARTREPRGLKALASLWPDAADRGSSMARADARRLPAAVIRRRSAIGLQPSAMSDGPSASRRGATSADTMRAFADASLLFFGGKGGVGKTTVAAAAALRLARADRKRRVLLLSTDPAHSLADVFGESVGDTPHAIPGAPTNLAVRELDAARAFALRREQVEAALDEIASAFGAPLDSASSGGSVTIRPPSAAASELITLAPPGIDELFGILSVVDARGEYDVIVVDTAPTGHALRLLEMPDAAREWTQVLLRMLLKYRSLVRPGRLAEELVGVSKSIRDLQTLLRNPDQTRFIVVTRAAEVPRRETGRLLASLRRLGLATPAIVVNALTLVPGRCGRCRAVAAEESRERAALQRLCARRCAIIQTLLTAPAPRGSRALERWAATWA